MSEYSSVIGDPSVAEAMKTTMRSQQAQAAAPAKSSPARVAGPTKQAADVSVTGDPSVAAAMKDTQAPKTPAPLAKAPPKKVEKKASLDDKFAADLHQAVGIDVPSSDPDWQRPDVKVADQTNDRIDDHYLAWMREQAEKDVVKEAKSVGDVAREIIDKGGNLNVKDLKKVLTGQQIKGGAKALGGTLALGGAAYGGYRLAKGRQKAATGVQAGEGVEKQAAVIENPENLALIDRIRRQSEKLFGNS